MLYYMWKSHWSQICGVQYLRSYSMWKILKLGTDRSAGLGYISFPIWCCKSATTTTDVHPSTRGLLIKHFSKTQTCLQKTLFRPLYSWNSVCIYCKILVCAKYYSIIEFFMIESIFWLCILYQKQSEGTVLKIISLFSLRRLCISHPSHSFFCPLHHVLWPLWFQSENHDCHFGTI